jgi:serralysin
VISAGSGQAIIYGGGDGDLLTAAGSVGDAVVAGPGAETITGVGSSGSNNFYAGPGSDMILAGSGTTQIQAGTGAVTMVSGTGTDVFAVYGGRHAAVAIIGFDPSRDFVALQNFPSGEANAALAGATSSAGSEHLTLSDGTQITLVGFTGLTSASML